MTPFAKKPILHSDEVLLRPFTADDAEAMAVIVADPELIKLTGSAHTSASTTPPPDLVELRAWYGSRTEQTDRLDLAVVDPASGDVVGEVVLNEWDPGSESANFRTLIGPAGRGRGLGTAAIGLFMDYAFAELPLHRISLEVYDFNPRARHVYEKIGFVYEGTLRDALLFDGVRVDAHVMAILRPDWEAARLP